VNLTRDFVRLAEDEFAVDWIATQRSVAKRLGLTSSFDSAVYDPRRYPTYWCVPLLVGSYVGASRRNVLADTESFVTGCLIRHFFFEPDRPFGAAAEGDRFRAIAEAYEASRLKNVAGLSYDACFAAKCLPWTVLLAIGTHSILAEVGERGEYADAMNATVLVHSCLQMVDDWHDQEEDAVREHWNMWVREPVADSLAAVAPLLSGSDASVQRLRPHLLRRALAAQLHDAASDLRHVVNTCEHGKG
jgi:hypothetical protein